MKRIVLVYGYRDVTGGIQEMIRTYAAYAKKQDYEIVIFSQLPEHKGWSGQEVESGIRVYELSYSNLWKLRTWTAVAGICFFDVRFEYALKIFLQRFF